MENFVGVMDSGIGGLTVLSQLQKYCPRCDFVYFADNAFCPYGEKTFRQIRKRVLTVANRLKNMGATEIVVACNTASLFCEEIQSTTKLPVYDVITPTCNEAANTTKNRRVALLATKATVQSRRYQNLLSNKNIATVAKSCGTFVRLLEEGRENRLQEVQRQLQNFHGDFDTIILGCTHFPLLQKEIASCFHGVAVVSCAKPTAQVFAQGNVPSGSGKTLYLTSGNAEKVVRAASLLGKYSFAEVEL